jgi:CRP-like cAMP-binding protein
LSKSATHAADRSAQSLAAAFARNRLLATFSPADRAMLEQSSEIVELRRGETLIEAGGEVTASYFPCTGSMVSKILLLQDGRTVEVATIGNEGAVGGIVSCGTAPAFARALVQIAGFAVRIDIRDLETLKSRSPHVRTLFCRYSDALLAQVMQSVACNAFHVIEARFCRWLLTVHDRVGLEDIPLTQEDFAQMLGVQRTTVTAIARSLQTKGLISHKRGSISILDRPAMEKASCECYRDVKTHFHTILPETKPQKIVDSGTGV